MSVSDHDIHRAAHLLIAQCGDNAVAKASEMVETMRQRGNTAPTLGCASSSRSGRWATHRPMQH
jgi:hypothetical protein